MSWRVHIRECYDATLSPVWSHWNLLGRLCFGLPLFAGFCLLLGAVVLVSKAFNLCFRKPHVD